jgi:hypothetical protein
MKSIWRAANRNGKASTCEIRRSDLMKPIHKQPASASRIPEKPLALATGTRANDDHYPPEGRGEGR